MPRPKIANSTLDTFARFLAENFDRIDIVPTEDGEKVDPVSNNSGVCSPVDQNGKPLKLRVVFKKDAFVQKE